MYILCFRRNKIPWEKRDKYFFSRFFPSYFPSKPWYFILEKKYSDCWFPHLYAVNQCAKHVSKTHTNIFQWYCPLKSRGKKCTIVPLFQFPNEKSKETFKLLILMRSRHVMLSQVLYEVAPVHDLSAPRKLQDMLPAALPLAGVFAFQGDSADRANLSQLCPDLSLSTLPGRGSRASSSSATGGLVK